MSTVSQGCVQGRRAYGEGRMALGRNPNDRDAMGPCFSESNLQTTQDEGTLAVLLQWH